jgi:glycosylphosphatidylinositol transamidase (GPIT) subunit GPI8
VNSVSLNNESHTNRVVIEAVVRFENVPKSSASQDWLTAKATPFFIYIMTHGSDFFLKEDVTLEDGRRV